MITRRNLVISVGASALATIESRAQAQNKIWRIGYLGATTAAGGASRAEALRVGLRELGYVEGKNLAIEYRWADGNNERFPALVAQLVRLNVDLILTHGPGGAVAAKQASSTIPIVVAATGDFVAQGLAVSLSRPGGNITGGSVFTAELSAKGLELLKGAIPGLHQVAALHPQAGVANVTIDAITATAEHLKVAVSEFRVQGGTDFEGAFAAMVKRRVGALLVPDNVFINSHVKTIAELALRHRFPSCGVVDFAEAGGMLGYGVNFLEMFRRAAVFIDKIFKGARPGDLPIERATKFDFVVNMKTAKALGVKIPQSILIRATKVIE